LTNRYSLKKRPTKFILVELDFPKYKEQNEEAKGQNEELQKVFQVQGYPSIFLLDSEGRCYAKTGYKSGGPESYLKHLDELQKIKTKRDVLFAQAAKATDVEKVKLFEEGLELVIENGYNLLIGYDEIIAENIKGDSDGKLGVKSKYEIIDFFKNATKEFQKTKNPDDALVVIEKAFELKNVQNDYLAHAYMIKASLTAENKDIPGAIKICSEGLALKDLHITKRLPLVTMKYKFHAGQNEFSKAVTAINEALSIKDIENADKISLLLDKTHLLGAQNNFDEAIAVIDETLKMKEIKDNDKIDFFLTKAQLLATQKNLDQSIVVVDEALKLKDINETEKLGIYMTKAKLLSDQNKLDLALAVIEDSLKMKGLRTADKQRIYYSKSLLTFKNGKKDEAIQNLKDAIDLDPESQIVQHLNQLIAQLENANVPAPTPPTPKSNSIEDDEETLKDDKIKEKDDNDEDEGGL